MNAFLVSGSKMSGRTEVKRMRKWTTYLKIGVLQITVIARSRSPVIFTCLHFEEEFGILLQQLVLVGSTN